jgi:hypothetical protein
VWAHPLRRLQKTWTDSRHHHWVGVQPHPVMSVRMDVHAAYLLQRRQQQHWCNLAGVPGQRLVMYVLHSMCLLRSKHSRHNPCKCNASTWVQALCAHCKHYRCSCAGGPVGTSPRAFRSPAAWPGAAATSLLTSKADKCRPPPCPFVQVTLSAPAPGVRRSPAAWPGAAATTSAGRACWRSSHE